jgi:hypothetical protein
LSRLLEQAGTIFDPRVVRNFVLAVKENREMVRPYELPEGNAEQCTTTENRPGTGKSSLTEMLKKCMLGF